MPNNRYDGQPPPARHPVPTYHVIRPQRDGPQDLTILANTIRSVITHWVESDETGTGCTLVCWQHEKECPYHESRLEWTGWLPVWDHASRRAAVLRLGPREADALGKALGLDLKWQHVRVKIVPVNEGKGKTIRAERVIESLAPAVVSPHDMTRTICLVLKCDHIPRQTPLATEADPEVRGL